MKHKLFWAGIVAAVGMSSATAVYAVTPTFSLYGVGNDSVQINASGDANSSVTLFYNVPAGATSGGQAAFLGSTDTSGAMSKSVSVNSLGLDITKSVYLMINSQQSAVLPWSASGSTTATAPAPVVTTGTGGITFNQSSVSMPVGGSATVSITTSGNAFYVHDTSVFGITTTQINGANVTISGIANGSTAVKICSAIDSNLCGTITVVVGASTGTITPTPVTTPAPITVPAPIVTPISGTSPATLVAVIQLMQSQIAQMLAALQTMQGQLAQLAASATASTGSSSSVITPIASQAFSGSFTGFLKLDSTGSEVTALQQKLKKDGFYSGPITGTFGPLTEAALKQYQSARGIDPAGYVGPSTRAALNGQ